MAMIANARMYSIDPQSARAWKALLEWIVSRAAVSFDVIDYPAPLRLSELWAREDLGAVFMCGLPYSLLTQTDIAVIAAPIPSPARYMGLPRYMTDIVVRTDAMYTSIEDTFGGVVGYTVRDSQSGYFALRHFLAPWQESRVGPLYRGVVGDLINARGVIDAIVDGRIDVGPLDSYCHDLLQRNQPEYAKQVRMIATTDPMPIPVFVAKRAGGAKAEIDLARVRDAFDEAGAAPELASVRDTLALAGFACPDPTTYAVLRNRHDALMATPEVW
jgi:ABC-type phosphate/phosphonate transport system substrate-binding protein